MKVHDTFVQVRSRDQSPDALVNYLVSSTDEGLRNATPERPAKRRKLVSQEDLDLQDGFWKDAVTLGRVTLGLSFADSPAGSRASVLSNQGPRTVYLSTRSTSSSAYSCRVHVPSSRAGRSSGKLVVPVGGVNGSPTPLFDDLLCSFPMDATVPKETREIVREAVQMQGTRKGRPLAVVCSVSCELSGDGISAYRLEVRIFWRNAQSMREASIEKDYYRLLHLLTPDLTSHSSNNWEPQDFYDNVHVPEKSGREAEEASSLKVDGLKCKLYPFQMRTVRWLLAREGADVRGKSIKRHASATPSLQHGFLAMTGLDNAPVFVNHWLGLVTTNQELVMGPRLDIAGGLLAEEMGLGKTVEVISLLLLHKQNDADRGVEIASPLPRSGSTIIISPVSIQLQWKSEINIHAPGLKVMIYDGVKVAGKKSTDEDLVKEMLEHDIVLVSYTVLSAEIHFAGTTPDRLLRHKKQYEKRKSPLVQICWWRCVLDECQMVESGVSQAARVANQIPRQNAWAVSGTPLKKDAQDLFGLLVFLRVEPYCYSQVLWRRLIMQHLPIFKQLFRKIAIRHSKDLIKADILLPPQKRVVITMPFTHIEEQYYSNLYHEMCEDLGLSLEGAPLKDDWDPNASTTVEKMRSWLSRLRQTVLHPEVGERNRRALGQREGPLRTVAEVLKVMTDQNDSATRNEERTYLMSKLRRGQILEHAKRTQIALELWLEVRANSSQAVDECRQELTSNVSFGAKEEVVAPGPDSNDDDESVHGTEQPISHVGALRLRLRSALDVMHMATFFLGNAYYQLKSDETITPSNSDRFRELEKFETDAYEKAKIIRNEMLAETLTKTNAFMTTISSKTFIQIPNCKGTTMAGGIESRAVVDRANGVCEILNLQAERLDDWREIMIKLLLLPLIDQEDEELVGDEYENSTKQQEEAYVYMETLRAAVADRHEALTGQENGLIKRDMGILLQQARRGEWYSPALTIKLLEERQSLRALPRVGSFRSCIAELRALKMDMQHAHERGSARAGKEVDILNMTLSNLQEDLTKQTKALTELEKEADLLRAATNSRIDYYRQLQVISDNVAPYEEDLSEYALQTRLEEMQANELMGESKIKTLKSRGRYLSHLRDESSSEDGPKNCIICQDGIEVGVLLSCGHQFCKECLKVWYNSHRKCPICKKLLHKRDFHGISYKPQELNVQEETNFGSSDPESDSDSQTSLYSGMNSATFAQIKNIDVRGSFGTKIDTLARHILWLRINDPGAKSIIFSQFRDFLDILSRAFSRFKIGYATIDDTKHGIERFKNDPGTECFFLHAKAHASGLNLVNATHVFLCEPLINTALELQAIARVHRIGQHNPTTVYMYLVEDTVEKAIYDISVTRRLEHIGRVVETMPRKRKSTVEDDDIEAANSLELQEASLSKLLVSGKGGGEVVKKGDLWDCLFGARAGGRARGNEETQRVIASFLGADAAEQRALEDNGMPSR